MARTPFGQIMFAAHRRTDNFSRSGSRKVCTWAFPYCGRGALAPNLIATMFSRGRSMVRKDHRFDHLFGFALCLLAIAALASAGDDARDKRAPLAAPMEIPHVTTVTLDAKAAKKRAPNIEKSLLMFLARPLTAAVSEEHRRAPAHPHDRSAQHATGRLDRRKSLSRQEGRRLVSRSRSGPERIRGLLPLEPEVGNGDIPRFLANGDAPHSAARASCGESPTSHSIRTLASQSGSR